METSEEFPETKILYAFLCSECSILGLNKCFSESSFAEAGMKGKGEGSQSRGFLDLLLDAATGISHLMSHTRVSYFELGVFDVNIKIGFKIWLYLLLTCYYDIFMGFYQI